MIVALEGGDQAGKGTQSDLLVKALRKKKLKVKLFSFPDYTTPIGREIKNYLDGKQKFPPQTIHCLLSANRWEKLNEIKSAMSNDVVIMNRYSYSNLIYGLVNGLKADWLENLDAGLPKADLIILLDINQKESFERKKANRDKFEKDKKFSHQISSTYKKIAKRKRWKIVDASNTRQQVHEEIMSLVTHTQT